MIKDKGIATKAPQDQLAPFSFERRNPKEHDVVIDIKYCGTPPSKIVSET